MPAATCTDHLYGIDSMVLAGNPGRARGFATRVGSGFKVLEPGWVRVAKFCYPGGPRFQSFSTQVDPVRKEMVPQIKCQLPGYPGYPGTWVWALVPYLMHAGQITGAPAPWPKPLQPRAAVCPWGAAATRKKYLLCIKQRCP